ncbi:MAG: putative two-component system sensor kinase [Verrucomicrobiales bacterium]|nr:putative two-component system sensor kinase [Verrucomicrobiales bacterium]
MNPLNIRGHWVASLWILLFTSLVCALPSVEENLSIIQRGAAGDIPVPADYDGDGKADSAFFCPSNATWRIFGSTGTSWTNSWGDPGDIPVPGDYDGDGKADVAIFRPADVTWYILGSNGKSWTTPWGVSGDVPVPADYDGDGKTDPAVFRPADGTWRIYSQEKTSRRSEMRQYGSRRWQTQDGLPHNAVSTVLQTHDGYLWLGTQRGLARFDGARFAVFNPQNTPELKGQIIRSLCQTRDDTLWIGTEDGGLSVLKEGQFSRSPVAQDRSVKTLLESSDGSLWIGTTNGLGCFKNGQSTWFTKTNGLSNNIILALSEDHSGNVWIGANSGLTRYKDKVFERYNDPWGFLTNSVRALFCDHENNLWVGLGGGGLARLNKDGFKVFRAQDGVTDGFITAIFEDSRHELWVGTMGGLFRRTGEKFVPEHNHEGAAYDAVFRLYEDKEGNVWLGTKEGLSQLRFKPFEAYTKQQGLSHNNAMSLCEGSEGTIWTTTWGGGLSGLKNGKVVIYNGANSPVYDLLLSVCPARDGSLWLGGDHNGGLFHFKDGTFIHYGNAEGIVDPAIRVIYEDRQGQLWIGTTGALYLMRDGKFQRFDTADGLAGKIIRAIYEDQQGNLWIGTSDGLTRRSNGMFSTFTIKDGLSANPVLSIYEDRERNLWIGTDGGGLNRFKDGKFTAYTTKQGLFNDSISEILEDDREYLWMSCFSGVFRVKKKDLDDFDRGKIETISCASYGHTDGMSSAQCNGVSKPAGWKGKDGRLWFPTTRGVVVVDPNSIAENDTPPQIVVENMIADKKDLTLSRGANNLIIPPGKGDLEFHYTALSFRVPEKNRFKYKLEGVDSEWVDAGTRRVAYYNNLNPRAYTFRVIGCNNDGSWNQSGATLTFVLRPHFWQTSWFIGLIALTAVGMVAGSVRYITWKKLQGKLLRLEHQHAIEKERTRIAQDMHDDLGARLTEILMLSNAAANSDGAESEITIRARKVAGAAGELVRNLDGIVWAVNPKNDSLESLTLYLCEYVQRFLSSTSIRCQWDISSDLPSADLSSEARHNIFLVFKEALNNAVKHSGASQIQIRLQVEQSNLLLSIEDNGKGFSVGEESESGNGLINMNERLRKIGGQFQLQSKPGAGTRITLRVPLR